MSAPPVLSFDPGAGDVQVDLGTLLETRMLVQGSSRSGKTWALYSMLEETHGRVQHLVVDREADFAPLRQRYPYLLVGAEGDLPVDLGPGRVEALVHRVLEVRTSVIFDLSDTAVGDQQEYVRRLAHTLAHLPRRSGLWTPALVVVDELQHFAPEAGKGTSVSTEALAELGSMGGKRGYCLVGATQRLAHVSKSVAGLLENKLILRTGAVDLKRAADELDLGREVQRELRSLERGHGYAYGPAISVDPLLVRIPSELEVTPPRRGELRAPPPPAPEGIQALLDAFRDLPTPEGEAEDLEAARERIRALEEENTRLRKQVSDAAAEIPCAGPLVHRIQVLRREHQDRVRHFQEVLFDVADLARQIDARARSLDDDGVELEAEPALGGARERESASPRTTPSERPAPTPRTEAPHGAASPSTTLPPAQQRIVDALERFHTLGVHSLDRRHLAVFADQSPKSSAYGGHVAALEQAGLVRYPQAGHVALTPAGRASASEVAPITTVDELHQAWLRYLPEAQGRILRHLIEHREMYAAPLGVRREDLAGAVGMSPRSSAYSAHVAALQQLGLVEYPEPRRVAAADLLFPEGLR